MTILTIIALIWLVGVALALAVMAAGALAGFTAWTAQRVETAVPPLGRFVEVDGSRIHYLDEGAGPAILFIHGLGGQMRNFTYALRNKLKSEHRIIIIDRPGSGYSTRPRHASGAIIAQAETIARFVEKIGLDRPLIVGHSLGGAIALALALEHPERIAGVALIAPLTHPQDGVAVFGPLAIKSPLLRRIMAWTLAAPMSIKYGAAALAVVFGPDPVPADFGTRGGGLLGLRPSSFIGASTDLMAVRQDLDRMTARYAGLKVPVGVLFGTSDRILDATAHGNALAAKLPGIDFELIQGAGHMLPISAADRSAAFIARMARRGAAGTGPAAAAQDAAVPPVRSDAAIK